MYVQLSLQFTIIENFTFLAQIVHYLLPSDQVE